MTLDKNIVQGGIIIIKQTAGRDNLGELAPKFAELNDDVLFGEVWSREDDSKEEHWWSVWTGRDKCEFCTIFCRNKINKTFKLSKK